MLEQLEKVDGVNSALANHTGTLVRVSLNKSADSAAIAAELDAILKKQNRKPKQLSGDEVAAAIENEQWLKTEDVGQLSEIEFRTVFERRVKQFIEAGEFDEETAAELLKFCQEVLAEIPASNQDTDWREFCGGLASSMLEKAKQVLDEKQLQELAKKLKARVIG